jgi:hypothetical protein
MIEILQKLGMTAAVVYALIDVISWIKESFTVQPFEWKRLTALGLAIAFCVLQNADVFPLLGMNLGVPFVGAVLTGVLIAKGANLLNDLIKLLPVQR